MTVSTTESRVQFLGDGSTTKFSFSFLVLNEEDVFVALTNISNSTLQGIDPGQTVTQVQGTDYTVSLSSPGGEVDFSLSLAPLSGLRVTIQRVTTALQEIDYVENDPFPADTHERGLDRAALRDQELSKVIGQALKYQAGDDQTVTTELPLKNVRKGKVLGFDNQGAPVALAQLPDVQTVTSFAESLLDDTSASEARGTLGVTGIADLYGVTGGTGSAYTLDLNPGLQEENGRLVVAELHTTCSDGATLNFNGNGPKPIAVVDTSATVGNFRNVKAGELVDDGVYLFVFNAGFGVWFALTGVSLGGITAGDVARKDQSNTFADQQTVSAATAGTRNAFAIQGQFSGARDFRLMQKSAGRFSVTDETSAIEIANYQNSTGQWTFINQINVDNINIGTSATVGGSRVLTTADEGAGNGLDADTVDGLQANALGVWKKLTQTLSQNEAWSPLPPGSEIMGTVTFKTKGFSADFFGGSADVAWFWNDENQNFINRTVFRSTTNQNSSGDVFVGDSNDKSPVELLLVNGNDVQLRNATNDDVFVTFVYTEL